MEGGREGGMGTDGADSISHAYQNQASLSLMRTEDRADGLRMRTTERETCPDPEVSRNGEELASRAARRRRIRSGYWQRVDVRMRTADSTTATDRVVCLPGSAATSVPCTFSRRSSRHTSFTAVPPMPPPPPLPPPLPPPPRHL